MNLNLAVIYGPLSAPTGTVVDSIVATIAGTAAGNTDPVSKSSSPGQTSFSFDVTVADTYDFSVEALDANGKVLSKAVTGSLAVTAPQTVTLQVPVSVSASQG